MSTPHDFATIDDLPTMTAAPPRVRIYGPPECPNCTRAHEFLTRHNVTHERITLTPEHPEYDYIRTELGYARAPVIICDFIDAPTVHWGGHRIDLLIALTRISQFSRTVETTRS